jgi:hypothetical protein
VRTVPSYSAIRVRRGKRLGREQEALYERERG